ncbi:MAG: hypothetical protein ACKOWF_05575 [Chloroflexota bacterium]
MPALARRTRQLIEAVFPGDPRPCADYAASRLAPALFELFRGMPVVDQRHGCRVAHELASRGWTSRAAAEAALMHDVGKSCGAARVRVPDRLAVVILTGLVRGSLPPGIARASAALDAAVRHPAIGAACLRDRGADAYSTWLVANHQRRDLADDPLLAALIAADDGTTPAASARVLA